MTREERKRLLEEGQVTAFDVLSRHRCGTFWIRPAPEEVRHAVEELASAEPVSYARRHGVPVERVRGLVLLARLVLKSGVLKAA